MQPEALLPRQQEGLDMLAKALRALGDPTRLRLLGFLIPEERTVADCVEHVGLAQSRVSAHLACLADCGYVESRRDGRRTYYRVSDPRVFQIVRLAHGLSADNASAIADCTRIPED